MLPTLRLSCRSSLVWSRLSSCQASRQQSSLSNSSSLSDSYDLFKSSILKTTNFPNKDVSIQDAMSRVSRLLDYTVPHGKQLRGNAVLSTVKALKPNASEELILSSHAVGWSVEIAQAAFLVSDDIMDSSTTRRGQDCWFRVPGIGMTACNDIMILQNAVYVVLDEFVRNHPSYPAISRLILDMIHKTCIGQILDNSTASLDKYSLERYFNIVNFKTGFYTVCHPTRLGLLLSGVDRESFHAEAEDILLEIGRLFQVQDDFLDVFGDEKLTGKKGTDIEDNKCTWLIVTALMKASQGQRKVLEDNYGKKDESAIQTVKTVFQELDIQGEYKAFEKKQLEVLRRKCGVLYYSTRNDTGKYFEDFGKHGMSEQVFNYWLDRLEGRAA